MKTFSLYCRIPNGVQHQEVPHCPGPRWREFSSWARAGVNVRMEVMNTKLLTMIDEIIDLFLSGMINVPEYVKNPVIEKVRGSV
ncbi:hypothetical protein [Rossellomorea sp. NS-SX7]|uniref:hypothetical protein n=1 Tax=Rossellomorea sp. NS-SX7 TaxID=3463856 RepID=UPI00405829B4